MLSSREIIKILKKDGWYLEETKGSHNHFVHNTKKGRVTVPHPKKDLPTGTIKKYRKTIWYKIIIGV